MPKKPKKAKLAKASESQFGQNKAKTELLNFSFRYYQGDHNKFECRSRGAIYLTTLLARLTAISGLSVIEFLTNRSSVLRCHPIDWSDTSETCFGFPKEQQLVNTPYQFSLSSNEHGRVHGFMVANTFYIVWLDPNHLLYPGR